MRILGKIVATFGDVQSADRAVQALEQEGFKDQEISVVAKDNQNRAHPPGQEQDLSRGTTIGAGVGLGAGLLASAGLLAVPGIGPLLAAGPLAAALGGAAIGGLSGALVDWGIPDQESQRLQKEVQEGRAVILMNTPDTQKAEKILRSHAQEVKALS